jgi:hypothetical protein
MLYRLASVAIFWFAVAVPTYAQSPLTPYSPLPSTPPQWVEPPPSKVSSDEYVVTAPIPPRETPLTGAPTVRSGDTTARPPTAPAPQRKAAEKSPPAPRSEITTIVPQSPERRGSLRGNAGKLTRGHYVPRYHGRTWARRTFAYNPRPFGPSPNGGTGN